MPKNSPIKPTPEFDRKFRFGLVPMFYAVTLIATGISLGLSTVFFSLFVIVGWIFVFSLPGLVRIFWIVFLCIAMFVFCSEKMNTHSPGDRKADYGLSCKTQMRMLQLGILNYESAHTAFPNATARSKNGKLEHSWRVMILPFIEGGDLHDQYDFNEPWDGPNNSKLASQMPVVFACPENPIPNKTPYKTVVGPGTAFETGKTIGFGQIPDGPSNTIAIVEDVENQINWMSPDDLSIEEALKILNSKDKSSCAHDVIDDPFVCSFGSINVSLLDGPVHTRFISPDQEFSSSVFTVADGAEKELVWSGTPFEEVKLRGYLVLAAYLILILLPTPFKGKR